LRAHEGVTRHSVILQPINVETERHAKLLHTAIAEAREGIVGALSQVRGSSKPLDAADVLMARTPVAMAVSAAQAALRYVDGLIGIKPAAAATSTTSFTPGAPLVDFLHDLHTACVMVQSTVGIVWSDNVMAAVSSSRSDGLAAVDAPAEDLRKTLHIVSRHGGELASAVAAAHGCVRRVVALHQLASRFLHELDEAATAVARVTVSDASTTFADDGVATAISPRAPSVKFAIEDRFGKLLVWPSGTAAEAAHPLTAAFQYFNFAASPKKSDAISDPATSPTIVPTNSLAHAMDVATASALLICGALRVASRCPEVSHALNSAQWRGIILTLRDLLRRFADVDTPDQFLRTYGMTLNGFDAAVPLSLQTVGLVCVATMLWAARDVDRAVGSGLGSVADAAATAAAVVDGTFTQWPRAATLTPSYFDVMAVLPAAGPQSPLPYGAALWRGTGDATTGTNVPFRASDCTVLLHGLLSVCDVSLRLSGAAETPTGGPFAGFTDQFTTHLARVAGPTLSSASVDQMCKITNSVRGIVTAAARAEGVRSLVPDDSLARTPSATAVEMAALITALLGRLSASLEAPRASATVLSDIRKRGGADVVQRQAKHHAAAVLSLAQDAQSIGQAVKEWCDFVDAFYLATGSSGASAVFARQWVDRRFLRDAAFVVTACCRALHTALEDMHAFMAEKCDPVTTKNTQQGIDGRKTESETSLSFFKFTHRFGGIAIETGQDQTLPLSALHVTVVDQLERLVGALRRLGQFIAQRSVPEAAKDDDVLSPSRQQYAAALEDVDVVYAALPLVAPRPKPAALNTQSFSNTKTPGLAQLEFAHVFRRLCGQRPSHEVSHSLRLLVSDPAAADIPVTDSDVGLNVPGGSDAAADAEQEEVDDAASPHSAAPTPVCAGDLLPVEAPEVVYRRAVGDMLLQWHSSAKRADSVFERALTHQTEKLGSLFPRPVQRQSTDDVSSYLMSVFDMRNILRCYNAIEALVFHRNDEATELSPTDRAAMLATWCRLAAAATLLDRGLHGSGGEAGKQQAKPFLLSCMSIAGAVVRPRFMEVLRVEGATRDFALASFTALVSAVAVGLRHAALVLGAAADGSSAMGLTAKEVDACALGLLRCCHSLRNLIVAATKGATTHRKSDDEEPAPDHSDHSTHHAEGHDGPGPWLDAVAMGAAASQLQLAVEALCRASLPATLGCSAESATTPARPPQPTKTLVAVARRLLPFAQAAAASAPSTSLSAPTAETDAMLLPDDDVAGDGADTLEQADGGGTSAVSPQDADDAEDENPVLNLLHALLLGEIAQRARAQQGAAADAVADALVVSPVDATLTLDAIASAHLYREQAVASLRGAVLHPLIRSTTAGGRSSAEFFKEIVSTVSALTSSSAVVSGNSTAAVNLSEQDGCAKSIRVLVGRLLASEEPESIPLAAGQDAPAEIPVSHQRQGKHSREAFVQALVSVWTRIIRSSFDEGVWGAHGPPLDLIETLARVTARAAPSRFSELRDVLPTAKGESARSVLQQCAHLLAAVELALQLALNPVAGTAAARKKVAQGARAALLASMDAMGSADDVMRILSAQQEHDAGAKADSPSAARIVASLLRSTRTVLDGWAVAGGDTSSSASSRAAFVAAVAPIAAGVLRAAAALPNSGAAVLTGGPARDLIVAAAYIQPELAAAANAGIISAISMQPSEAVLAASAAIVSASRDAQAHGADSSVIVALAAVRAVDALDADSSWLSLEGTSTHVAPPEAAAAQTRVAAAVDAACDVVGERFATRTADALHVLGAAARAMRIADASQTVRRLFDFSDLEGDAHKAALWRGAFKHVSGLSGHIRGIGGRTAGVTALPMPADPEALRAALDILDILAALHIVMPDDLWTGSGGVAPETAVASSVAEFSPRHFAALGRRVVRLCSPRTASTTGAPTALQLRLQMRVALLSPAQKAWLWCDD
jgi:hypothetical protein